MGTSNDLLLGFYGDDFTGSTDAMEGLTRAGLRTVMFIGRPKPEQLAKYEGLRAVGLAGCSRTMSPAEMDVELGNAFRTLKEFNLPMVHYKVCSTFDSSPTIGSIGHALDIGAEAWRAKEAKAGDEAAELWGPAAERGPAWETVTATNLLQSGADLLVMRHPKAVEAVRNTISQLFGA